MMENNNIRYKVIWIDDECETRDDLIPLAAGRGIDIKPFKYGKSGIEELENNIGIYVGVILDVVCFYDEDDEKGPGADGGNYFKVWTRLRDVMAKNNTKIPIFVYSAEPGYYNQKAFIDSVDRHKIYPKEVGSSQLLDDIKTEAEKLPETQIRHKYLSFINDDRFQKIEPELIKILTAVENDETNDPNVIMGCRQVLNWIMPYLHETVGVLQRAFNESNLSECSMFLGQKEMSNLVPIYIQRSLHSCVDVSNNGSHRVEVFNAVKDGKAPFLTRSTVFELLNILSWCATLSTKPEDVDKMKADVARLNISMKFIVEGELQKDEHGNYHCGDYLVTYSQVESYGLKEGDILRIGKSKKNDRRSDSKPYEEMAVDGTIEKV